MNRSFAADIRRRPRQMRSLDAAATPHHPRSGFRIGLHAGVRPLRNPPRDGASHHRDRVEQSGWADSNRRPSDPQSDALTKLRYSP